ncbi:abscisic acid receptor PYL4 [Sesbania bispinosa]|nr:abscisic acid receptor PYL4 [Sesbania bispinosa]
MNPLKPSLTSSPPIGAASSSSKRSSPVSPNRCCFTVIQEIAAPVSPNRCCSIIVQEIAALSPFPTVQEIVLLGVHATIVLPLPHPTGSVNFFW